MHVETVEGRNVEIETLTPVRLSMMVVQLYDEILVTRQSLQ